MQREKFVKDIATGFEFKGESIILGGGIHEGEVITNSLVKIPLKTLNRHGLIAGATGTGKTKTLQIIAEQLSRNGVPTLLMDIKGDLSGIAAASTPNPKLDERHAKIGIEFVRDSSPVEFLSLSEEPGVRLRATVSEFGPVLFSKILGLNDTQSGIVSLVFKYCDDHNLPLLDLADMKKTLQWITGDGKAEITREYGTISTASVGTISRKIIELEQQGAEIFFGETSFDVNDLVRFDRNGKGIVSILRVTDIQDKPKLFSTFMLQLLAEIYANFPEQGDADKPKLCLFIDEAHLVFNEASKVLLDQIESVIKLIRSKGVGIFFITQSPVDIPQSVLGQLGFKVQHALRAFTAKDRQSIKLAAQNFPDSPYYKVDQLLTQMGIGEALITALNEKGIPTPLVHTYLRAPQSRMDVLTAQEIDDIIQKSQLISRYNKVVERESAYEILQRKMDAAQELKEEQEIQKQAPKAPARTSTRQEKSTMEKIVNSTTARQIGRTVANSLVRGLMGVFLGGSKSKKGFW